MSSGRASSLTVAGPPLEAFDQVTAGGVAQGPEDLVDRLILKH